MRITILGSGTSTGVPYLNCTCEVCRSADPRDARLRCSALVEVQGKTLLIDCGPDFRQQMLHRPTKIWAAEKAASASIATEHRVMETVFGHWDELGMIGGVRVCRRAAHRLHVRRSGHHRHI